MPQQVVWFNHNLSVVSEVIQAIKRDAPETKVLVSHKNAHFVGFEHADSFFIEDIPSNSAYDDHYLEIALDFAMRNGVTHIVVGDRAEQFSFHRDMFYQAGIILLLCVDYATSPFSENKIAFASFLENLGLKEMLPMTLPALQDNNKGPQLIDAISSIKAARGQDCEVCVKPAVGTFGQGFFRIETGEVDALQQLMRPEKKILHYKQFESLAHQVTEKHDVRWMVMEYLPGPEYSADALAYQGRLASLVIREKQGADLDGQLIVADKEIQRHVAILAKVFQINGVFNAQFRRDMNGQIRLLEINPRFSGGLGMSLLSGVNLPLWWLRLTDEGESIIGKIPEPQYGMRVYAARTPIILADRSCGY